MSVESDAKQMKPRRSKKVEPSKPADLDPNMIAALKSQVEDKEPGNFQETTDEEQFRDKEMSTFSHLKGEKWRPEVLAILAALLDPANCRTDEPRSALDSAVHLLMWSSSLSQMLKKPTGIEDFISTTGDLRIRMARLASITDNKLRLSADPGAPAKAGGSPELGTSGKSEPNNGEQTVGEFLREELPLDGKDTSKKSWETFRMIRTNLNRFIIWNTNGANVKKARILDSRPRKEGASEVSESGWMDPEEAIRKQWADWQIDGEENWGIPRSFVRRFVQWYRCMKRKRVGLKKIRPLSLEEVKRFVKREFPSKRRKLNK